MLVVHHPCSGRPNYAELFGRIRGEVEAEYVGVMFCGPARQVASGTDAAKAVSTADCKFHIHRETFGTTALL